MKKGSFTLAKETIGWVVKIIILILICVIIVGIVGYRINKDMGYYQLQNELLKQKLLSDNCIGASGEIDLAKVDDSRLARCASGFNGGVNITLYDADGKFVKEAYFSKDKLTESVFCDDKFKNDVYCYDSEEFVNYGVNNGILKISMVSFKNE